MPQVGLLQDVQNQARENLKKNERNLQETVDNALVQAVYTMYHKANDPTLQKFGDAIKKEYMNGNTDAAQKLLAISQLYTKAKMLGTEKCNEFAKKLMIL
ncbi:MAG: hypothetical protein QXU54_01415 [Candidatus Micrarchaeia archaeon]